MEKGYLLTRCAEDGDLDGFKQVFEEAREFGDLLYWHTQRSLRLAVQHKQLFILEYLVDTLELNLNETSFQGFLHSFIRNCAQDLDEAEDEDVVEINRQILRYLAKAAGKQGIDAMEEMTGSTVLHTVCE